MHATVFVSTVPQLAAQRDEFVSTRSQCDVADDIHLPARQLEVKDVQVLVVMAGHPKAGAHDHGSYGRLLENPPGSDVRQAGVVDGRDRVKNLKDFLELGPGAPCVDHVEILEHII